jgi:hypothetical protein
MALTHSNFNYAVKTKSYNKIKSEKAKENKLARNSEYYEAHKEEMILKMKINYILKKHPNLNREELEKLVSIYGYEEVKKMLK